MANEIVVGFESGQTIFSTVRNTSGQVWYVAGQVFEDWGTSSRTADDYAIALTDSGGGLYIGDFPSTIPNGNYYLQTYFQAGASPADTDTPYGGPTAKTWNGSTLTASPSPGSPGTQMTCQEMIDEVQQRLGRPNATGKDLVDVTWCTRRLNEAQREIVRNVPMIPCLGFVNKTTFDTTGTISYALTDLTIGDSTTDRPPHRITDIWYLDGNSSRKLTFLPVDEFDRRYPDPTHADAVSASGKPKYWTQRTNDAVEMVPYCASTYWDKNLRFDGDFWPAEFTTDVTGASDISGAEEGLILYSVWKGYAAIGLPGAAAWAKKAWTNPNPAPGEEIGWLEGFRDRVNEIISWDSNFFEDDDEGYL